MEGPQWSLRVDWPRLTLRSVREEARLDGLVLPVSRQHHLILFARGGGRLAYRVAGAAGWEKLSVLESDIILRRGGAPSHELRWEAPSPVELIHVHVPGPEAFGPGGTPATMTRFRDPLVEQLMRSLERAARHPDQVTDPRYAELAGELLVLHLVRHGPAMKPAPPQALGTLVLRRVLAHVEDHLAEPLTLAGLARVAGLSPYYFGRAFKAATGSTPHRYVQKRRVIAAERLLLETDLDVAEIAVRSGFSSQSRLTEAFRQQLGAPPAAYRRSHRPRTA